MYKSYSSLNRLCSPITPAKTNNEKYLPQNDPAYSNPKYGYPQIIKVRKETHRVVAPELKDYEHQVAHVKPITFPESIKAYRAHGFYGENYNKDTETKESGCTSCSTKESFCASCRTGDQGCTNCKSTICTCDRLDPIMDPRYNLREVAKQLILLQDHLALKKRRCTDCITKHCLTVEALLEEAITLDQDGQYVSLIHTTLKQFKLCMKPVLEKIYKNQALSNEVCHVCSQELRQIRKPLCLNYAGFC